MNLRKIILPGAVALALALGSTAAGASTTAAGSPATPHPSVHTFGDIHLSAVQLPRPVLPRIRRLSNTTVTANNWSGYAVTAKAAYQTQYVTATWNIPSTECGDAVIGTSGENEVSNWAGLDGFNSNTVEQDGTAAICTSTTSAPTYLAWYEMYPLLPVSFSGVSPGDSIQAIIRYLGRGEFSLILNDLTTHAGFSVTESCPSGSTCLKHSAEVITEDPGTSVPAVNLPDYGMANYDNIRVAFGAHSGSMGNSTYWNAADEILMVDPSSVIMSQPSALFGGQAFSTIWKTGT